MPSLVGWQKSRLREPQNTQVFEDHSKQLDAPDDENKRFEKSSTSVMRWLGGSSERTKPDPIPNSDVKTFRAKGTAA